MMILYWMVRGGVGVMWGGLAVRVDGGGVGVYWGGLGRHGGGVAVGRRHWGYVS